MHNGHLFYVLVAHAAARAKVLAELNGDGINAVFHYVPLHSSNAGRRFGHTCGSLLHTDELSARLIRLPLWIGLESSDIARIVSALERALI